MIDLLRGIVDFLVSVSQFIYGSIQSVIWVISSIPKFISSITAVFAYCPSFLLVFLEISLAITVLLAIFKLL